MINNQTKEKVKNLLVLTKNKLAHQEEIREIKGETFNIFSILGVEHYENKTHSNFIAELLNPKGSHFQSSLFLEAFLETIKYSGNLNISETDVIKEYHISNKSKNNGGRIDILIKDKEGNYISIENKIYAGDQENQLIRYTNFEKINNKVFYLTLFGDDASEFSTKDQTDSKKTFDLKSGEDYFTISYANDIIQWLTKCHQLAADIPQLREAIKQYLLLIKKLTNQTMENREEMIELLFQNHEAAQYIQNNFNNLRHHIQWQFREDVVKLLKKELDSKFDFRTPNAIHKKPIAQIFIANRELNLENESFEILIESFNDGGHYEGNVFIGVLDFKTLYTDYSFEPDDINTEYWKPGRFIKINNEFINFQKNSFLKQIGNPKSKSYQNILTEFVKQCVAFINIQTPIMEKYINNKK